MPSETLRTLFERVLARLRAERERLLRLPPPIWERLQVVEEAILQLQDLMQRLQEVLPDDGESPGRRRYRGATFPYKAYRPLIAKVLAQMGGRGYAHEVLERLATLVAPYLAPGDWDALPSDGELRWRKNALWQRYAMKREGLLVADSPRGVWELSESGWDYARKVLELDIPELLQSFGYCVRSQSPAVGEVRKRLPVRGLPDAFDDSDSLFCSPVLPLLPHVLSYPEEWPYDTSQPARLQR